jgi:hypothetical protein
MDTITQVSWAHPMLRKAAIGAHVLLAAWLLINGVAHQVHVLIKAYQGTLKPGADVSSLLAVGAGLIVAGALASYGIGPLARPANPSLVPAFLSAALLALVLVAIARVYGMTFLGGSIALGLLDVALLTAHAVLNASKA